MMPTDRGLGKVDNFLARRGRMFNINWILSNIRKRKTI